MSTFDDPNREAVGQPPIWTGAEAEPKQQQKQQQAQFDPGEHTVADVQAYLEKHPDEYDAVLAAEKAGKNRATLTGD